jgi:hypothetical protein
MLELGRRGGGLNPSDQPERPEGVGAAATWTRGEAVLWRGVLDDVVVLAAAGDGDPIVLTGGDGLWQLLGKPRTLGELGAQLASAAPHEDLNALLSRLSDFGIVVRAEP